VDEAQHFAEYFHPSVLQHIHELPLVWRPNSAAGAPQHFVVVFAKSQEKVSSMHTALPGVLSVAAVCQITQRVWLFSDLVSSSFQPVRSQLSRILISRCAPSYKGFTKTEYRRFWNVSETYAITGSLGSKRLETELVKFHCLEFAKAKPPELSCLHFT